MKLNLFQMLKLLKLSHPQALMSFQSQPSQSAVLERWRKDKHSAPANNALEDADGHFLTSSARLQFSHGKRDYGPVVQDPSERPDTPSTR